MRAFEIAAAVRAGRLTARASVEASLARIAETDPKLDAFTDITAERALARADVLDARRFRGDTLGPLAGVPFAVKNLFDIATLPTRAGSKINRDRAPAAVDALLVERLEAADAILVGGLNMGEYAYDFTGENVHDGPSRNPHDPEHMSGGSSGGSATAVAAGMVPLSLGSDTNGSIRVPSSFCGLFGLKPTYGRLPRTGTFPFVHSLDHLGPFARSVTDLAVAYDAMQGHDPGDPGCADRVVEPVTQRLEEGIGAVRVLLLDGYFRERATAEALEAVDRVAAALGSRRKVKPSGVAEARAAAYLITMAEGAALHLDRLCSRAGDFDPAVRNRLLAGAMLPAAWVVQAQKVRRAFHAQMLQVLEGDTVLLAPATPCRAPKIGQKTMVLGGEEMLVRPNLGLFSQPISCIGLPVCTVPVWTKGERLPIGVQVIGPPWREDLVLRTARKLEADGVVSAPVARI
ncbi:MAG: AtzE family amidohydrolase [Geminicoccaceae bacterium]